MVGLPATPLVGGRMPARVHAAGPRRMIVGLLLYAMALARAVVWVFEGRLVAGLGLLVLVVLGIVVTVRARPWAAAQPTSVGADAGPRPHLASPTAGTRDVVPQAVLRPRPR